MSEAAPIGHNDSIKRVEQASTDVMVLRSVSIQKNPG